VKSEERGGEDLIVMMTMTITGKAENVLDARPTVTELFDYLQVYHQTQVQRSSCE
jgi:hypothetical protein